MDKKYQDIHIVFEDCFTKNGSTIYDIRQVTIKSIQTTDMFIKVNVIDTKDKSNLIIVPKLSGVKVLID